jgi:hypothetical protein
MPQSFARNGWTGVIDSLEYRTMKKSESEPVNSKAGDELVCDAAEGKAGASKLSRI